MKKKQKNTSHVFIYVVVLILIAGIGAGYFLKHNSSSGTPITTQSATDDEAVLKKLAGAVADGWNIPDLKYEVTIPNRVGDYARVVVTPTNQTLDPLQIIFVKKEGTWVYENMGTSFPDLEQQIPELFRD